jgi:hypothetical protein
MLVDGIHVITSYMILHVSFIQHVDIIYWLRKDFIVPSVLQVYMYYGVWTNGQLLLVTVLQDI